MISMIIRRFSVILKKIGEHFFRAEGGWRQPYWKRRRRRGTEVDGEAASGGAWQSEQRRGSAGETGGSGRWRTAVVEPREGARGPEHRKTSPRGRTVAAAQPSAGPNQGAPQEVDAAERGRCRRARASREAPKIGRAHV